MTAYHGRRRRTFGRRYYSRSVLTEGESGSHRQSLVFVRNEFFHLDIFTFERFSDFYGRKYGNGAKQYMRKTYPLWQAGTTRMAGQTERRILKCVPPFLNKDKQFELLSYQIPSVIHQHKSKLRASVIRSSELESTYQELAAQVIEHEPQLDWFVEKVFPDEEIADFLKVFKYTMLDCLRTSFGQVLQDLVIMHSLLRDIDGSVDLSYHIALLDCPLEVDVYLPPGALQLHISMPEPSLVTQFRDQYRALLLDHALAQCKASALANVKGQIAIADIQTVVDSLQRTAPGQEYDSLLEVHGNGGTLRIRLQKKNLLRLRYAIVKKALYLILTLVVGVAMLIWGSVNGYRAVILTTSIVLLFVVFSMWEGLSKLKSEVKEYERKRAARVTAS